MEGGGSEAAVNGFKNQGLSVCVCVGKGGDIHLRATCHLNYLLVCVMQSVIPNVETRRKTHSRSKNESVLSFS